MIKIKIKIILNHFLVLDNFWKFENSQKWIKNLSFIIITQVNLTRIFNKIRFRRPTWITGHRKHLENAKEENDRCSDQRVPCQLQGYNHGRKNQRHRGPHEVKQNYRILFWREIKERGDASYHKKVSKLYKLEPTS